MAFSLTKHTLAADLETDGTVDVDYPAGKSRGDFLGAYAHFMSANQNLYKAPNDFTVVFNASNVQITWKRARTLVAGTLLSFQFDRPGAQAGRILTNGIEIPGSVPVVRTYVSLGSPVAADPDGLVESVTPAAGGVQSLTLVANDLDVPRNVTVTSAADETARTFTVTGVDVYGHKLVEEIAGANAGAAVGDKAFARVSSVTVDDNTAGAVTVGWGVKLGLPMFLDAAADAQRYENGAAVSNGTLTVADKSTPTASTGDVRGTWAPNTAPNGNVGYAVVFTSLDPSYLGAEQFAG